MDRMEFKLEESGGIAILTLRGSITGEDENTLRSLLMRLLYNFDHIVLNFKEATGIAASCRQLFFRAYGASMRLKKPINMIGGGHGEWDINVTEESKALNYSEELLVHGGKG